MTNFNRPQDLCINLMRNRASINFSSNRRNPNVSQILNWTPSIEQMEIRRLTRPIQPIIVKTENDLKKMTEELKFQNEIVLQLRTQDRHSYCGMTCIVQITSAQFDYVIEVLPMMDKISKYLQPILEAHSTMKIMFDLKCQTDALKRDFGIFPIGCIDIWDIYSTIFGIHRHEAEKCESTLTSHLASRDSSMENPQDFDWCISPLPDVISTKLASQSFYLLEAWQKLKEIMLKENSFSPDMLKESKAILTADECRKIYRPAEADAKLYKVNNEHKKLFVSLHKWRNLRAKIVDEQPEVVLSTKNLKKIATIPPLRIEDFRGISVKIPRWIDSVEHELINLCRLQQIKDTKTSDEPLILNAPEEPIPLPNIAKRPKWQGTAPNYLKDPKENLAYQRRRRKWNLKQNRRARFSN